MELGDVGATAVPKAKLRSSKSSSCMSIIFTGAEFCHLHSSIVAWKTTSMEKLTLPSVNIPLEIAQHWSFKTQFSIYC